ncbi:MAG: exodeoxyribonuclease VII small subunit [Nitrospirota bacterium]|nr:MAG: exodeoxyribonuclease VII small subunit [Nitrospirota bacterium]
MTKKKQIKYKEAFDEIEAIIAEIEDETIDIDELASKVKRASELIKFCRSKLMKTEKEVKKVLEEFEEDEDRGSDDEGLF